MDLQFGIGVNPAEQFLMTMEGAYDMERGEVRSLFSRIRSAIGDKWENKWDIEMTFLFDQLDDTVRLDTIRLIKDLHRRKITFTYNYLRAEFTFLYTLNAFADEKFGITSNEREGVKLEGLFDDQSPQRY